MQALTLALLLALSAAAEPTEDRQAQAPDGWRVPRVGPQMPPAPDPCVAAREIISRPPCLAAGDCEALQLWRRSFGSPRVEPLEPSRAFHRSRHRNRPPPPSLPGRRQRLAPGFVCPAGADPPR